MRDRIRPGMTVRQALSVDVPWYQAFTNDSNPFEIDIGRSESKWVWNSFTEKRISLNRAEFWEKGEAKLTEELRNRTLHLYVREDARQETIIFSIRFGSDGRVIVVEISYSGGWPLG